MKVAYLSPFRNDTNLLTEIQKALLAENGFRVLPFSFRTLLSPAVFGLLRRDNVVLLNWLERRPFAKRGGRMRLSLPGLLQFAVYLAVLIAARARVVYIVHDHAVHETEGRLRRFSSRLIALLRRIADARVVHDPSACERYRATYLPHPLYWEFRQEAQPASIADAAGSAPGLRRGPVFKALGAIKSYKALHEALACWPGGAPLEIRGRGDAAYVARLQSIVAERALDRDVSIHPGLMTEDEFDRQIASADVLLLPHAAGSMLVSGAFFEGAGRARAVLARRTPFMEWAAAQMPGVFLFGRTEELPALVARIQAEWADLPQASQTRATAEGLFGRHRCVAAYGAVLLGPLLVQPDGE